MVQYLQGKVCQLSAWNYKVEALVGPTQDSQVKMLTVFDTGAGPNLIRAALLPDEVLNTIDTRRKVVSLCSASNHKLDVLGVVTLTVTIADLRVRQPFVVVSKLGADVILGCTFIDHCVDEIRPRQKYVVLRNGSRTTISRRPHAPLEEEPSSEPPEVPEPPPKGRHVRVASRVLLEPRSETAVLVTCGLSGTFFLENSEKLFSKKMVSLSNGVVSTKASEPFVVMVANFSDQPQTLSKHERLGTVVPVPDTTLLIEFASDKEVPSSPLKEGRGNSGSFSTTLGEAEKAATDSDPKPESVESVEDIELDHLAPDDRERVRQMLRSHSDLWSGH